MSKTTNCPNCKILHDSLLEMCTVAATAMRVIAYCEESATDAFERTLRIRGIADGFGKRADAALEASK